jgi:polyisoprenoid-binding protein YceI
VVRDEAVRDPRVALAAALLSCLLLAADGARAEPFRLVLDPAATEIGFTLGARLHTVRGSFALTSGDLVFDPATGAASGEIRADARSGDTGVDRRDRVMHEEVLDSAGHPLLAFRPERVQVAERGADALRGRLFGRFEVRGVPHPLAVDFEGTRAGERAEIRVRFDVPWVAWGLPDPSNALLSVDDVLAVQMKAVGTLSPASAPANAD